MGRDPLDRVPGRNEPDPENIRMRSFQGGDDGLTEPPTEVPTFGGMKYLDGEGPFADVGTRNAAAGLSGLPQANSGTAPALFNDPQAPSGATGGKPERQ